jgi:hypothetical protein
MGRRHGTFIEQDVERAEQALKLVARFPMELIESALRTTGMCIRKPKQQTKRFQTYTPPPPFPPRQPDKSFLLLFLKKEVLALILGFLGQKLQTRGANGVADEVRGDGDAGLGAHVGVDG